LRGGRLLSGKGTPRNKNRVKKRNQKQKREEIRNSKKTKIHRARERRNRKQFEREKKARKGHCYKFSRVVTEKRKGLKGTHETTTAE